MARLPNPGGDDNTWGDILNAYLEVSLNNDGTLKPISASSLDSSVQTSLGKADSAVQSVNGKTGSSVTLNAGDISAVATSQLGAPSGVATLDSGSHLTSSQLPSSLVNISGDLGGTANNVQVATVLGGSPVVSYLKADATGATDVGAALQSAFDALGSIGGAVHLKPGGTYLISTPVFLDSTNNFAKYVLNCNGAYIKFGSGLPLASTMSGLSNPGWAFFNNTLRSALSGGTVTTTTAQAATGSNLPPAPHFVINDGVFDAQTNIIGLAYGNGASTLIRNSTFRNIACGISWNAYVDENGVDNCQTQGSNPTGGQQTRMIYQRDSGDGTTAIKCKGYGGVILDLASCHGFLAESCVSGQMKFIGGSGAIITGHQETAEISSTPLSISLDRTRLNLYSDYTFPSTSTTKYTININDTADNFAASILDIQDHIETYYLNSSNASDAVRGATIHITAMNQNGSVRCRSVKTVLQNGFSGAGTLFPEGLLIDSAVSGITSAITAGIDQIATGNFDLGFSNAWVVSAPAGLPPAIRTLTAPTLAATADNTGVTGSLSNGTTYQYVAACKSADGRWTALAPDASAVAPSTGAIQLTVTNPSTPCVVALWRATTSGVDTAPDHYVEIPLDGYKTIWFDTGANINGRAWQTSSLPVPNTVASSIAVTGSPGPAGIIAATIVDRGALAQSAVAFNASGQPLAALFRHPGGLITNINFRTGGTAGTSISHAWAAIESLLGTVVAVTGDTTSVGASTVFSWALTTPTVLAPGLYYVQLNVTSSGTMPNVLGSSGSSSAAATTPPIATGNGPTGQTTAPAVGASLAAPSSPTGVLPYIWFT